MTGIRIVDGLLSLVAALFVVAAAVLLLQGTALAGINLGAELQMVLNQANHLILSAFGG